MRGQHTYPWSDAIRMLSVRRSSSPSLLSGSKKASLFVAGVHEVCRLRRARRPLAISAAASVAFPPSERGRHSVAYFRSSIVQPASTSVYASLCFLAEPQSRLEARMESLLLSCGALSPWKSGDPCDHAIGCQGRQDAKEDVRGAEGQTNRTPSRPRSIRRATVLAKALVHAVPCYYFSCH